MVRNLSGTTLTGIKIVDDNGTPNDPSDDFVLTVPTNGDNNNGVLDKNETWVFIVAGAHRGRRPLHERRHRPGHDRDGVTYFDDDPGQLLRLGRRPDAPEGHERRRSAQPDGARGRQRGHRARCFPIGTPVVWTYRRHATREHRADRSPSRTTSARREHRRRLHAGVRRAATRTATARSTRTRSWLFTSAGVSATRASRAST